MKDPAVRDTWTKRVERWKDSGLSAKAFAAEMGINARSLSWWRWHLAKGESPPAPIRRRRRRSPSSDTTMARAATISPITFVEMAAPAATDGLEIILRTRVRVCVRPGFDDATLGRLLDVLERRP
jgi:transposase